MHTLLDSDQVVLKQYAQALSHLRERKRSDRIALFFGAGISKPLSYPTWKELIDKIQEQPEFADFISSSDESNVTFRAQSLIQYLTRQASTGTTVNDVTSERVAKYNWVKIVHRCLYDKLDVDDETNKHPYLKSYLSIIKDSPLTINYNFDDCIERMLLSEFKPESNNQGRVFETVWEPSTQYQRSKGVIYHPNGYLPKNLVENYSENIIFAESEFADQLIHSMYGHYSTLVSHLSRYTSLLIGLSLDDPTLKHILRQNTTLNPGHVHYWLKYCEALPTKEAMEQERDVNFEVFGVVTIHLTESDFAAFGRLIACSDEEFAELADRLGVAKKYVYYVTGAVGAGKTSSVHKLKSLCWFGEWLDRKPDAMAKPHVELTPEERTKVDEWVSTQFRKKNRRINEISSGVIICDRSPIDPLVFTKDEARTERAKQHFDIIKPQPNSLNVQGGHIIFLTASGTELHSRSKHRHQNSNAEYLDKQQRGLKELYKSPSDSISEISTSGRTVEQVARHVAKVIHLGSYIECDLHDLLCKTAYPEV